MVSDWKNDDNNETGTSAGRAQASDLARTNEVQATQTCSDFGLTKLRLKKAVKRRRGRRWR